MESDVLGDDITRLKRVLEKQFVGKLPDRILDAAVLAAARVVAKHARRPNYRFRDRTGQLRKTIKARRIRRGGKRGTRKGGGSGVAYTIAAVSIGGEGARQGALIELGTHKMKGRTPIQSAIEETVEAQRSALARVGEREMRKAIAELNSGALRSTTRRALGS